MMMVSRISLQKLDSFLTLVGFKQCSVSRLGFAWVAFLLIGVALPVVVLEISNSSRCDKFQIKSFELDIIASQACLAAVSLFCDSFNLRKWGFLSLAGLWEKSHLMRQVEKYADIYTSRVSNFHHYTPFQWCLGVYVFLDTKILYFERNLEHYVFIQLRNIGEQTQLSITCFPLS